MKKEDNAKKFVLKYFPSKKILQYSNIQTIKQGFLRVTKNIEVKVVEKKEQNEYWIICKSNIAGKGRSVEKIKINKPIFDFLFATTKGQRIIKERFTIVDGDYELRFDKFINKTKQGKIWMLELDKITTNNHKDQSRYLFPNNEKWTNELLDVSDDEKYLNQNLAA